jgi:hypothetical protein
MSDNGGQLRVLRDDDINQFADLVSVATQQVEFRKQLVGILEMSGDDGELKAKKMRAFEDLLTAYHLVYTENRYNAVIRLTGDENYKFDKKILEKLWAFVIAFGHKDVGQFN